jgi:hypothetical protein
MAITVAVFALSHGAVAKAQELSPCFAITDADPQSLEGALTLGRIRKGPSAALSFALPTTCENTSASCGGVLQAHAKPGAIVAVGQSVEGFVCVHGPGVGEDGWIAASRLDSISPSKIKTPLSAWAGTWRGVGEAATITIEASGDQLRIWLETHYPNNVDPDSKVDCATESSVPDGALAIVRDESYPGCTMRLLLVGNSLAVTASDECSDGNLRYGSFYIRDNKIKPVRVGTHNQ